MLTIGLTGGIASGKSTVSNMLGNLGAPVFDADKEAHRLTAKDGEAYQDIKNYFCGQLRLDIIADNGEIDRKKLGALVFADNALRAGLENILHGRVEKAMNEFISHWRDNNAWAAVLDIPLLIEKSWQNKVDRVWLVYLPEEIQIRRLRERDNIDEAAAQARLNAQIKLRDKLKYADSVIDNSGSVAQTQAQVQTVWRTLENKTERKIFA